MLQRDADKANVIQPKTDPRSKPSNLLAIVGDHTKVHGKFDVSDSIQIDCEIGGQLRVGEKLVIGANGVVHADIETVDAIIYGEYEGDLVATGRVEITPTGRVRGSIKTNSLIIAEGALCNGRVALLQEPVAAASPSRSYSPVHESVVNA